MRLSIEQGRIVGCLIEKQMTTPQQYPLTLNALVLACNQSSNRYPVVAYEEVLVQRTLASLKEAGLVRFVYPSSGRSATRYRQVLGESLGLDEKGLALLAVLLLRGPQTAGELRTRTERMATFDGLPAVSTELEHMAGRAEPLVLQLPRRPGQKEERWAQLLAPEAPAVDTSTATGGTTSSWRAPVPENPPHAADQPRETVVEADERVDEYEAPERASRELSALEKEVVELRAEVAALRDSLEQLRSRLSG
ncbi:MAG: YceH family protein [Acidimicrobiales bacterium]